MPIPCVVIALIQIGLAASINPKVPIVKPTAAAQLAVQLAKDDALHLPARQIIKLCETALADATLAVSTRVELHTYLAKAHKLNGDADRTIAALQEALRLDPKNIPANLQMAREKWERDQDDHVPYAQAALDRDINHPTANMYLSQDHLYSSGELKTAIAYADRAIAAHPNHADALYAKGNTLQQDNKLSDAKEAFSKAIRSKCDTPSASVIELSLLHVARAEVLMQLGEYEGANRDIQQAIAQATSRHNLLIAHCFAWRRYYELGYYQAGELHRLSIAKIAAEENTLRMHVDVATDLSLGRRDEAKSKLNNLFPLIQHRYRAQAAALPLLIAVDREREVAQSLDTATGTPMESMDIVLECKAYLYSSSRVAAIRDGKAALAAAKELCTRTMNRNPKHLMLYAMALAESGQYDQAVITAKQAISRLPADAPIRAEYNRRQELFSKRQPYRIPDQITYYDMIGHY